MKRILSNEKGYSLFIAVLITVVFMVIAVSLLSMTMAGTSKSSTREEIVQSTELSDKGMQHITQQIYAELQNVIPEEGLLSTHFQDELEETLNKYLCDGGTETLTITTETGEYEACIEEYEDESEDNPLRKIVTVKSTGIVNGKERTITFTVAIGANAVPDALNYALGVHKTCSGGRDCIDGEGNLFLHGASEIQGDLKVDGNIITTNRAYAYLSGQRWIESLYPSALPGPNTSSSKIVLGGNIYTFSNSPNYDTHISRSSFNRQNGYQRATVDEAFADSPQLIQRSPIRENVEITEQRQNFRYSLNDSDVTKVDSGSNRTFQNEHHSGKKVFGYYHYTSRIGCGFLGLFPCDEERTTGDFTMRGNNTFGQFATDGNLTIREGKVTFENGLYVNGNLTIGNRNISDREYDPDKYEDIEISGPIYVNGDLTIIGADAKLNALIYVNGDVRRDPRDNTPSVRLRNSRINGLTKGGREGSLIIFANKDIQISNNSVNQKKPSEIRGYFYSEDALEMFGVGSNLYIEGGLSARRVVLNAIRGRADSYRFDDDAQQIGNDFFESREKQVGEPSRLTIIYNPEIINTYSDLKSQEPVIYDVPPPQIIDRNN